MGENLIIDRAEGCHLIDTDGGRYIDGVSSLWCNVHGHRVAAIDDAVRAQLDKVAHTTLLGLASPPSIELAAQLCAIAPGPRGHLNKVFYTDAGATALEVAFKMAVGYWYHTGEPKKNRFIALSGAYHGDTAGSMSVGFSDLFHRAFRSMVFDTTFVPVPDAIRTEAPEFRSSDSPSNATGDVWPSENVALNEHLCDQCLNRLDATLKAQADQTAAIVVEPAMQGAAGMICQPPGYLRGVAELAKQYNVLLIADEVATGFGRTGAMFACEHEDIAPDIVCMAKGITGGYLPLAATLCTDEIEQAFCGELDERKTLYHGHTYTGSPLGCAAALASLSLFKQNNLLAHIQANASHMKAKLHALHDSAKYPHVVDVRQRGLMVGIELGTDRLAGKTLSFADRTGAKLCLKMRERGLIIRPIGDVIILMPIPAMPTVLLDEMLDIVLEGLSHTSD